MARPAHTEINRGSHRGVGYGAQGGRCAQRYPSTRTTATPLGDGHVDELCVIVRRFAFTGASFRS